MLKKYLDEIHKLALASFPLILIQFCGFSKGFADTIMVANLNSNSLAAMGLASGTYYFLGVFAGGFINSIISVLSRLIAQDDYKSVKYYAQQSFYLNCIMVLVLVAVFMLAAYCFKFLDLKEETIFIARQYIVILGIGYLFTSLLNILRPVMQSFTKNKQLMYILVTMSLLNLPLNYLFIYTFGWGAAGSAYSTVICFSLEAVFLLIYISNRSDMNFMKNLSKPDLSEMYSLFKLGAPSGMSIMAEVGAISVLLILMTPLGENAMSAHQVVYNYSCIVFSFVLGHRFAVMRRVSFLLGLNDFEKVKIATISSMIFSVGCGLLIIALVIIFSDSLIGIYTKDPKVLNLVAGILAVSWLYQLLNTFLSTSIGVIRAYKMNKSVLKITMFSYSIFAIILGYMLSLYIGLLGFWVGLVLCLVSMNILSYIKVYAIVFKQEELEQNYAFE